MTLRLPPTRETHTSAISEHGRPISPFVHTERPDWPWTWEPTLGERVELRRSERVLRRGRIEAVMHDSSGFWLEADGVDPRIFVHMDGNDFQIVPF